MTKRLSDDEVRAGLLRRGRADAPDELHASILAAVTGTPQVTRHGVGRFALLPAPLRLAGLAAVLALMGALAFATISGGSRNSPLTGDVSPSPPSDVLASPTPASTPGPTTSVPPVATTPPATDLELAVDAVTRYERALAARDFASAWALRAAPSRAGLTLASFSAERSQFLASSKGQFSVQPGDATPSSISQWLASGVTDGVDPARAAVVEVDFPALSGNNAGYEVFLVSPVASGEWLLWQVR